MANLEDDAESGDLTERRLEHRWDEARAKGTITHPIQGVVISALAPPAERGRPMLKALTARPRPGDPQGAFTDREGGPR